MKNLRKVFAVITAIAVLTVMSVSAFAIGKDGVGITITGVTVTSEGEDLYNVAVDYSVSSTNNIGITLLAYAGSSDLSVTSEGYDEYSDTMQIVGIDQVAQDGDIGSFTFAVTTAGAEGAIKMNEGQTGIVLLGGDGVTAPAAAPFTIGEALPDAAVTKLAAADAIEVDVTGVADANVVETVTAAFKAASYEVEVYANAGDATAAGSIAVEADWIDTAVQDGNGFKAEVSIPAGVTVGGYKTTAATDYVYANVYWEADTLAVARNEVTLENDGFKTISDVEAAVLDAVKLGAVTVKDGDIRSAAVTDKDVLEVSIEAQEFDPNSTEDQTFTAVVTLPANAEVDGDARVSEALTANVAVTVSGKEPTGIPYILGDADGDGSVAGADWMETLDCVLGRTCEHLVSDGWNIYNEAADVDLDDSIAGADWMTILDAVLGRTVEAAIGETFTYVGE